MGSSLRVSALSIAPTWMTYRSPVLHILGALSACFKAAHLAVPAASWHFWPLTAWKMGKCSANRNSATTTAGVLSKKEVPHRMHISAFICIEVSITHKPGMQAAFQILVRNVDLLPLIFELLDPAWLFSFALAVCSICRSNTTQRRSEASKAR
jgi:hypothetical protein